MAISSIALVSDLLSSFFPQDRDGLLRLLSRDEHTLKVVQSAAPPGSAFETLCHQLAKALIGEDLVFDPLLALLREARQQRHQEIDAFLCAFLVRETASQLARLGPDRLNEWIRYEAPGPLKERLQGKSKDAHTVAAQFPALIQRERGAALKFLSSLWPDHSPETVALDQLIRRWGMVAEPTPSTIRPTGAGKPPDPNDLRQFVRTLDRLLVWRALLDACQRSTHQLLVVRGDPEQSLGVFRERVRRDLSNQARPHTVRTFGPGQDHSVATTAAGWAELLCESVGHAELSLSAALWEDTQRKPALYIVGLNEPLHLGDGGLSTDELSALVDFITTLPAQLPALGAQSPVRLLLPVQVDAALGADDPVFKRIEAAVEAAEANDPRGAVEAVSVGALKLPDFDELRDPLKERARRRPGHTLTEADWAKIRAAHAEAVARRAPFTALAEAIWRALPLWMQEP